MRDRGVSSLLGDNYFWQQMVFLSSHMMDLGGKGYPRK